MKKPRLLLCLLSMAHLCLPTYCPSQQNPLDQPAKKTVTVGSEIVRGYSSVAELSNMGRYADFIRRALVVRSRNTQNNTDTDGFQLGYFLGSAMQVADMVRHDPGFSPQDIPQGKALTKEYFDKFVKLRASLGLDNKQIGSLFPKPAEFTTSVAALEAALKNMK